MNIYMVLLIFITSCRFLIYGIINLMLSNDNLIAIYTKYSNLSTIVIPLCYLYFKNLNPKKSFDPKELFHIIFPIFYFLITFEIYSYVSPRYLIKLFMLFIFIAFLCYYIWMSYQLLKKNIWNKSFENKTLKKQNKKIYNWTVFLFMALLLAATRLSISLFIEISQNTAIKGLSLQWLSSIIWITILIKILITPEILYGYQLLNEKLKENRNSNLVFNEMWQIKAIYEIKNSQHLILKEKIDAHLQNYFEEIEKITLQNTIFRDPKLTVTNLATKLRIPKSHLSYLFKYHATLSFSEYKKLIRIQDAIKLIENGYLKNNTLDSLSKKIGFTSYNPFFTSFKDTIGIPPLEYLNQINSVAV
ncbi:MAG: AraC family transcriptional regulator [Flavobacterium sp.]